MARFLGRLAAVVLAVCALSAAEAAPIVLIVHADDPDFAQGARDNLFATGRFDAVDLFDATSSTPLLGDLTPYDAVLAYTDYGPSNATALGDVLADYSDAGGNLVLSTYGFSGPWALGGRVMTTGYSPFTIGGTGDVSGDLVALVPGDPIFDGVDLASLTYLHNGNFADPGLDAGATLLADDGAGVYMIARNADGDVIGLNLFPAWDASLPDNNGEFYELLANALIGGAQQQAIPEPCTVSLLAVGALGLLRRRRRS